MWTALVTSWPPVVRRISVILNDRTLAGQLMTGGRCLVLSEVPAAWRGCPVPGSTGSRWLKRWNGCCWPSTIVRSAGGRTAMANIFGGFASDDLSAAGLSGPARQFAARSASGARPEAGAWDAGRPLL